MAVAKYHFNSAGNNIIPANDAERVAALHSYCILDTPPEENFDNIAHLVAATYDAPIAFINLVDEEQVFCKACVGVPGVTHVARGISLCSLAILSDEPTVFSNTLLSPCLQENPIVHGSLGIRFYAAAPLTTTDGFKIGAVGIADFKERSLTLEQLKQLQRFARLVMHELEVRLAVQQKTRALEQEIRLRQKHITSAVIKAQEKERSIIAAELHDNVNQMLTTVKLYNEMAIDGLGDAKMLLQRSYKYLQQCIDEIRSLSRRLSAPTLGDASIDHSIGELVASINLTDKLHIDYCCTGTGYEHVCKDIHTAVYRIVQEQLNNIIKHSGATKVSVAMHRGDATLDVMITDNGSGFDLAEKRAGIGLTNIKARAESMEGTLHIMSMPGKGCTMQVTFPLA